MQKITDDLIERFLKGLCTEEEAATVSAYFEKHPEDPRLMDEFMMTEGEGGLPMGYSEDMLGFIKDAMGEDAMSEQPAGAGEWPEEQARGVRSLRRWVWAAAVILGVCGVYLLRVGSSTGRRNGTDAKLAAIVWVDKINQGKKDLLMTLADGSSVKLAPGARIRYRADFLNGKKRAVEMSGVVRFDVARNEQLPFVVTSGGLNTNVLGTNFEVSALPAGDRIKIRLYGGSVMVSLDTLVAGNERKDYYLSPGQEFVYDKHKRNVAINVFGRKQDAEDGIAATHKTMTPDSVANWYMFNNQTLADVFDQLSVIYNVHIQCSRRDISKLYFIGKLEKRDSLDKIIQDIALLNHLSVKIRNGSFIITRTKP